MKPMLPTDRREIAPALPERPPEAPFPPARSAILQMMKRHTRLIAWLWCIVPLVGLAASPADVPRDLLKPGRPDVVRRKGGRERQEGTILNVDPTPKGNIRLKGRSGRPLKRSEWEVEFWEGVTNAEALVTEAERLFEQIGEMLDAIALSKMPPSPEEIKKLAKRTRAYLTRITDKPSAQAFLQGINPKAPQVFTRTKDLTDECGEEQIEARIATCQGQRETVKEVQRSVGELAAKIPWAAEQDLAQECLAIRDSLKQKADAEFQEEEVIARMADALGTLHDTLAALKELGRRPKIEDIDAEAMPKAIDQLDKRVDLYQTLVNTTILGEDLLAASKERLAEIEFDRKHARACEGATSDVVALRKRVQQFQSDVHDGKVATTRQFEDQASRFEESLKQILGLHQQGEDDVSKYAFRQADRVSKDLADWKPRAEILMDLPKLKQDLDRVKPGISAAEAREIRKALEAWQAKVQFYRKGKGTGLGGEREKELWRLAAKLPGAIRNCAEMESDSAYFEARDALSTITDDLQNYVSGTAEPPPNGWLGTLEQDLGEIPKLEDSARGAMAEARPSDKRWKDLVTKLGEVETEITQAISLARVEEIVAAIPGKVTTRDELNRGDGLAARARNELQSVPDAVSANVEPARERVRKQLAEAEQVLERGRAQIQFQEDDEALTERLDAADAALAGRDPSTAGVELLAGSRMCDGLAQFVEQTRSLADSDRRARRLKEQQDRLKTLRERRRQVVFKIREDAGWMKLPTPDSSQDVLQVPPTPENRRLHLMMLIDAGELQKAEEFVARAGSSGEPQPQSAIQPLRNRILFDQAVQHEKSDNLDRAYVLYQQLYSPDSEEPVSVAAGAALNRLDVRFQRDRDDSFRQQRLVATILGAMCLVATVLVMCRRRTKSGRVAAMRRYLGKADQALRKNGGASADAYLRRAAELMAGLPPDDPHVRDLEQQLIQHSDRHHAVASASKDRIRAEQPDVTLEVRRILRGGRPTEDAASCCLRWLRETPAKGSSRRLRREVGVWLQRHLKPEQLYDDDELAWRARLAEQCEKLAPKTAWPLLYQARAHYLRGDYEAAMRAATRWESKRLRPAEANEVLVILGRCYVALGRWKNALETFRMLLKRKGAPPQTQDWMHFAWTQRQIQRNARIERDDLDRVIPSLIASGATREGPSE